MKQNQIYKEAGARIEKMRCKCGYTRKQFAGKVNISEKFLYEIENGKKGFSAEILWNISESLGVSCDYILTGKRKKGKADLELMALLEQVDEADVKKLIELLKILDERKN